MGQFVQVKVTGNDTCGFGLCVTLPSGKKREYSSMYVDRNDAEELCDMINRNCVSEEHISEIIEDALP